jgi:flagella basal body P-ring formation protein FlgA
MIRIVNKILFAFLVFAISATSGSPVVMIPVRLYDAVISGEQPLHFGDLIELDQNSSQLGDNLNRQIFTSQPDSQTLVITSKELIKRLPPGLNLQFDGASSIEVIYGNGVNKLLNPTSIIERRYHVLAGDSVEVSVQVDSSDRQVQLNGELPIKIMVIGNLNGQPGRQPVSLEFYDAKGTYTRYHVEVTVTMMGCLAFPNHLIKRGQIITANDLRIEKINLHDLPLSGLILNPEKIIGYAAARHLSPYSPVRWDQVSPPPVMHKGDRVDLIFRTGVIEIKAGVCALEDGAIGQSIWVKLESNGKKMRAVVVDQELVTSQ